MRLRSWVSILGLLGSVVAGISSPAHASIYPTAHATWTGASLDAINGVGVSITPLGSNANTGWTYYSDPCGPGNTSSSFCFEFGIIPNNTAWLRVEYANSSDAKFIQTPGTNCQTTGIGNNVFRDPGSTELTCTAPMQDFSFGTSYGFNIRPDNDSTLGPGNWWLARYNNEKTGGSQTVARFRFDLTPTILNNMKNFRIINQLNGGLSSSDCSTVPETLGKFSNPYAVVLQADNSAIGGALPNVMTSGSSSSCSPSTQTLNSNYATLGYGQAGQSQAPSSTLVTSAQDLLNNCDNGKPFSSSLQGSLPQILAEGRTAQKTSFDLLVNNLPLGTCVGVDIWLANSATPEILTVGLVNQINASSSQSTNGWTTNFRLLADTHVLGCNPFYARPWYVNSQERSFYGGIWSSSGCSGTPALNQLLGSAQSFSPVSSFPNGLLEADQRNNNVRGWNSFSNPSPTSTPSIGNTSTPITGNLVRPSQGGTLTRTACPKNKYLVGISISNTIGTTTFNFVQHLQYFCSSLDPEPSNFKTSSNIVTFVSQQPGNKSVNTIFCPQGSAAADLVLATGEYVKDISLSCYNPTTHFTTLSSLVGAGVGLRIDSATKCPPMNGTPTLITGVDGYAAAGIDAIQAVCGEFSSKTTSTVPTPSTSPSPSPSATNVPEVPTTPRNPIFSYSNGVAKLSVEIPTLIKEGIKGVYLVAPLLGFSSDSPLQGVITGTKALFSLPTDSSNRGTSVPVQIYSETTSTQSAPLLTNISIPSVTTPSAKPMPISKPGTKKTVSKSTPKAKSDPNQASVPEVPTNPGYDLVGDKVIVTVDLAQTPGAVAKNAFLVAPQIGITANHPLAGKISGNQAHFSIKATSSLAGKTASISVYLTNAAGRSPSLAGQVTAPPVLPDTGSVKAPAKKPVVKSKTASCKKGAMKRIFTGSTCPPGWLKA